MGAMRRHRTTASVLSPPQAPPPLRAQLVTDPTPGIALHICLALNKGPVDAETQVMQHTHSQKTHLESPRLLSSPEMLKIISFLHPLPHWSGLPACALQALMPTPEMSLAVGRGWWGGCLHGHSEGNKAPRTEMVEGQSEALYQAGGRAGQRDDGTHQHSIKCRFC